VALALEAPQPVQEPKAGFFARLFGRKSKPALRPSLEIEIHEDRIEAAAHALDEVSGESFSSPADAPPEESFASVEDALPIEEAAAPEIEPVEPEARVSEEELRFAPPIAGMPVDDDRATVETAQEERSTLELQPFDPFAPSVDSRATIESTPEPRSTEEIALDEELGLGRSTMEVDAPDLGATLETIEAKTDEFAIPADVDVDRPTGELDAVDDGETTGEMPKQLWWQKLLGIKPKDTSVKPALGAGATVVEGNPNFLFTKFRTFYNEIIRLKHQKSEFTAGFSTAIVTEYTADLSPDAAAEKQSLQLAQMLELQLAEANWMGGEARDRYPDAQYAMAVLADEMFTHFEWEGQVGWQKHLLEVKLFKSHAADVEFFKRVDKLLKDRPNSPVARDLARVYLLVIAAGFQGKYRPFGLTRALAEYRQRLFEYIHQGDALMLFAPERKIFPEAASRTLEGHAVSRFTAAQRWAAILVFLVLGYTVLAHYTWNRVSADLKDVTERIRAASSNSGAATSPASTNSTAGAR
jgi:type IV/VI secretion system ImpK/VasF family protein